MSARRAAANVLAAARGSSAETAGIWIEGSYAKKMDIPARTHISASLILAGPAISVLLWVGALGVMI
jgi:hypothetical protein